MSLKPQKGEGHGHEYWYQVPEQPRGVTLLLHGCGERQRWLVRLGCRASSPHSDN